MKKYFLFAIGNFEDDAKVSFILDSFSEIMTSQVITYNLQPNLIILNFGTNMEFEKLEMFANSVLEKGSTCHFLVEYNDNMSVRMNDFDKECFLNLDIKDTNYVEKISGTMTEDEKNFYNNMILEIMNTPPSDEPDEDDDDDDLIFKSPTKQSFKLDDILDKINDKGIDSLSQEEKNYLQSI